MEGWLRYEADTGDITVKLKSKRDRGINQVIAEARAQDQETEPELNIKFTQVLRVLIGDLANTPEPIRIKVFSSDAATTDESWPAPRRHHQQD